MILFLFILALLALLVATEDGPQPDPVATRPFRFSLRRNLSAIRRRLPSLRCSHVRREYGPRAVLRLAQTGCVSSGDALAGKGGPLPELAELHLQPVSPPP